MGHSSVQVSDRMRRLLARYKLPGMSYEDVLDILTAAISPAEFQQRYPASRVQAARTALGVGRAPPPIGQDEEARLGREAELRSMTPVQRMDLAFRLFELTRGLP